VQGWGEVETEVRSARRGAALLEDAAKAAVERRPMAGSHVLAHRLRTQNIQTIATEVVRQKRPARLRRGTQQQTVVMRMCPPPAVGGSGSKKCGRVGIVPGATKKSHRELGAAAGAGAAGG
jgi:hypothetical protein